MPMKLSICVRLKMHVNASHCSSGRKDSLILLSSPTGPTESQAIVT